MTKNTAMTIQAITTDELTEKPKICIRAGLMETSKVFDGPVNRPSSSPLNTQSSTTPSIISMLRFFLTALKVASSATGSLTRERYTSAAVPMSSDRARAMIFPTDGICISDSAVSFPFSLKNDIHDKRANNQRGGNPNAAPEQVVPEVERNRHDCGGKQSELAEHDSQYLEALALLQRARQPREKKEFSRSADKTDQQTGQCNSPPSRRCVG